MSEPDLTLCFGGSLDGKMTSYKGEAIRALKRPEYHVGAGPVMEMPNAVPAYFETYVEDVVSFAEGKELVSLRFYRLEGIRNIDVFEMLIDRYSGGNASLNKNISRIP